MNKQTLGWIFFGLGVLTSIIAPLAAIFYIVAIVFFAKSRKETGGMVGLIISIVFGILALIASLIFVMLVFVGIMGGIPSVGSGSAYYDNYDSSGGRSRDVAEAYWDTAADISVKPVFSASGNHILSLKNNQHSTIEVTGIVLNQKSINSGKLLKGNVTLRIGQQKTLNSSYLDFPLLDSLNICLTPGDQYSIGIEEVTYTRTIAGTRSEFSFQPRRTLDGTCAN